MKPSAIELDTPIVPRAVAEAVLQEASAYLNEPLPRNWVNSLVVRSNAIYQRNPTFRRQISARGNSGRDRLWSFQRHWLAALIKDSHPHLFPRLPSDYQVGRALPMRKTI